MRARVNANGVRLYEFNSTISPAKGFLANGEEIEIKAEYGGWCQLMDGRWVEACYTEAIEVGGEGGVSSWNDLTDKPFYCEGNFVEWDGNGDGLELMPGSEASNMPMYKVSDLAPTADEVLGGVMKIVYDGKIVTETISEESLGNAGNPHIWVYLYQGFPMCMCVTERLEHDGGVVTERGIYLSYRSGRYISYLDWRGEMKRLDSMYLPWLVVEDHGDTYSANMTYDEAVSLWERGSLMGGHLRDAEGQKMFTHIGYTAVNNYFTLTYEDGELMLDWQGVQEAMPM